MAFDPAPVLPARSIDERQLARTRWRCRRGMLENDLILTRFLDAHGSSLTAADLDVLDCLLELSDNELWDALAGRTELSDPDMGRLLAALRNA